MGYCMTLREYNFCIKEENKINAHTSIIHLMTKIDKLGSGGLIINGKKVLSHYAWISTQEVLDSHTLEEAFKTWRWELLPGDNTPDMVYLDFEGEKLGDDKLFFDTIAPYVEDGSYIEMGGEDGFIWRWIFENGKCTEKEAKITF